MMKGMGCKDYNAINFFIILYRLIMVTSKYTDDSFTVLFSRKIQNSLETLMKNESRSNT